MDMTGRARDLVPACVGLALFVAATQVRMDEPWSEGVLLVVAAVPAAVVLALAVASARGDDDATTTVLLVAGLALAALTVTRLGQVSGDDNPSGGTLTWLLAAYTALAGGLARATRASVCVLVGSVAAVGTVLAAVNWIFESENPDTYRALLIVAFVVLFGAGLATSGRAGTILVAAAGVAALTSAYALGVGFVFGGISSEEWGWELAMGLEGLALLAYAAAWRAPGPGYLAFFVLLSFVVTAGAVGGAVILEGSGSGDPGPSLVGWPLALGIATALAAGWGLRPRPSA
jgi:hypothetical protein